jgi:DNA-binding NtrC family response regulator
VSRDFGDADFSDSTDVEFSPSRSKVRRQVLLVLSPDGIREFDLPESEPHTVGRAATSEIFIDHPSVSRAHAKLTPSDDGPVLEDLGSRNGTFVNDARLGADPRVLHVGDTIRFGDIDAQIHLHRLKPETAKLIEPKAFDAAVPDEAERCVRFNRSFALVALESMRTDRVSEAIRGVVARALRPIDSVTVRGSGRLDVLVSECAKEEAVEIANRLHKALTAAKIEARLGVAAYPSDATSPESLFLAAQLAMHSISRPGVAAAREAARMFKVGAHEIIVAEPSMARLYSMIERLAQVTMPVLVMGETGTGKELVAEALHTLGPRERKRLVKINCAAVPENLLESELFGHERGAFTGAQSVKPGLIEEANGGTLFLDEIGEMNPALQAKLLRVLEDGMVRRIGAVKDQKVAVRLVAATNRDLKAAAASGQFREDLFYRLSTTVLKLPPLRERRQEIPLLSDRFLADANQAAGKSVSGIAPKALKALKAHAWPGNVRELKNVIAQAVVACDGDRIEATHLPPEIASAAGNIPSVLIERPRTLDEEVREFEKARIVRALEICEWNQTKAAEYLQTPRRTLVYKIHSLGIERGKK